MNLDTARQSVIRAGMRLVEKGLIARTWGNVSCRLNENEFVITPKGRTYESLAPGDIVRVSVSDCSYDGGIEPSSETGFHADIYRLRPEVSFIIHTHQPWASAVSTLNMDIETAKVEKEAAAVLGEKVAAVPYGFPGSGELRQNVAQTLAGGSGKAYLMVSHGALFLGENSEEVFRIAESLEQLSLRVIEQRFLELRGPAQNKKAGRHPVDFEPVREYYVSSRMKNDQPGKTSATFPREHFYDSERRDNYFILYSPSKEGQAEEIPFKLGTGPPPELLNRENAGDQKLLRAAQMHAAIYSCYSEINAIVHSCTPDVIAVSRAEKELYPLLDDFAQIIGLSASSVKLETGSKALQAEIASKLKERSAVLVPGSGALCCGPNLNDARAAALVLDKNCKAEIAAFLFGKDEPIDPEECARLRRVYLDHYSKKAHLKQED